MAAEQYKSIAAVEGGTPFPSVDVSVSTPGPVSEAQSFTNITSTTTVRTGAGRILGIFCASASSTPTIKVADNATTIVNTFTPAGGTFYPIPAYYATSLVVTISGTVDCTVFWSK